MQTSFIALSALLGAAQASVNLQRLPQVTADLSDGVPDWDASANGFIQTRSEEDYTLIDTEDLIPDEAFARQESLSQIGRANF